MIRLLSYSLGLYRTTKHNCLQNLWVHSFKHSGWKQKSWCLRAVMTIFCLCCVLFLLSTVSSTADGQTYLAHTHPMQIYRPAIKTQSWNQILPFERGVGSRSRKRMRSRTVAPVSSSRCRNTACKKPIHTGTRLEFLMNFTTYWICRLTLLRAYIISWVLERQNTCWLAFSSYSSNAQWFWIKKNLYMACYQCYLKSFLAIFVFSNS